MRKILIGVLASAIGLAPLALGQSSPATQSATDSGQSAEQMMNQMLKTPVAPKPLAPMLDAAPLQRDKYDKTSGRNSAAVAPATPAVPLKREGTFIFDAPGHLSHSADGTHAEFNFESDGKTLKDPPVIILPNIKLMIMEDAVKSINRDMRFRVTGMLTEYRGRNYILLERVTVPSDATQQF